MTDELLRTGSWNVREGVPARDENARDVGHSADEVVGLINAHRLDLLALQELDFGPNGRSVTADAIVSATDLRFVQIHALSPSEFDSEGRSAIAIASRSPLDRYAKGYLRDPRLMKVTPNGTEYSYRKGWVAGRVPFAGLDLTFSSVHSLPFHRFDREAEDPEFTPVWAELARDLDDQAGDALVVGGDFNTPERGLLQAQLKTPVSTTFANIATHRRQAVDDLLFSPALRVVDQVLAVDNFSDHKLCVAVFGRSQADGDR